LYFTCIRLHEVQGASYLFFSDSGVAKLIRTISTSAQVSGEFPVMWQGSRVQQILGDKEKHLENILN